jgi:hypothetical protein
MQLARGVITQTKHSHSGFACEPQGRSDAVTLILQRLVSLDDSAGSAGAAAPEYGDAKVANRDIRV